MQLFALTLILGLPLTLSPERAVLAALADADTQAVEDQPFLRYLFHPGTEDELALFTPGVRLHVNLISREVSFAYPKVIVPGLWRVDIRDYAWDARVFEKLSDIDPYFHRKDVQIVDLEIDVVVDVEVEIEVVVDQEYGHYDHYGRWKTTEVRQEKQKKKVLQQKIQKQKVQEHRNRNLLYVPQGAAQLAGLALLLQTQVPIVRADWFFVQGARQLSLRNQQTGAGYFDFLGLKSRDDYFKLIGLDERQAQLTEIRAVIRVSGVADQNRQIVQDGATTGLHWKTLETDDQSGRGIAINNLRNGEFLHVAEEHYGHLPNGLPATLASDDKGVLQATVPDKIAGDRSQLNTSNDLRVHVNLSCMRCHRGAVLMPFEDDVRKAYTGRLQVLTNDKGVSLELQRNYGTNINRILSQDAGSYQDAITVAARLKTADAADAYARVFNRYAYDLVTLDKAAQELGVAPGAFKKALKDAATRLGVGDFRLDTFILDTPTPIPRLDWEDTYQDAQDILYGVLKERVDVQIGGKQKRFLKQETRK